MFLIDGKKLWYMTTFLMHGAVITEKLGTIIAAPPKRWYFYRKDTEPLFNSFMYSLLSTINPLPAMHSLLVTLYVTEYHN